MAGHILSLDPSSTAIGWAEMSMAGQLEQAGVIRSSVRSPAYDRVIDMNSALRTLLDYVKPATILIEWTVGKVAGRQKLRSRGAGLGIYGIGVGAAVMTCYWYQHEMMQIEIIDIIPVVENDWTRGVHKRDRQAAIALQYTAYDAAQDPGADMADAIGLAQWWLQEQRIRRET